MYCINTLLCPIKVTCNTIELIVHTLFYCVSDLLCANAQKVKRKTGNSQRWGQSMPNKNGGQIPNSGFTPGTPVFAHYTSARRWYAPHDLAEVNNSEIERVTEMGIKKLTLC